jgi:hypothetical protein
MSSDKIERRFGFARPPWRLAESWPASPFAHRMRTRDPRAFAFHRPDACRLLLLGLPTNPDLPSRLTNLFTGLTGVYGVAADFGHQRDGIRYAITSGEFAGPGYASGPHFVAWHAMGAERLLCYDVSGWIAVEPLWAELQRQVADLGVNHVLARHWASLLWGPCTLARVTCSSLIGRAILAQKDSLFAYALLRALKTTPHLRSQPEITPGDIALALAFLDARVEQGIQSHGQPNSASEELCV